MLLDCEGLVDEADVAISLAVPVLLLSDGLEASENVTSRTCLFVGEEVKVTGNGQTKYKQPHECSSQLK